MRKIKKVIMSKKKASNQIGETEKQQGQDMEDSPQDANSDSEVSKANSKALKEAHAKIEALQAELDLTKDRALRALADADNTRKRAIRERDDSIKYSVSGFAKDLLDVADNFRRAIDSVPEDLREGNEQIRNLLAGLEAVEKNMQNAFEKHGIKKLEPKDEIFDPNYHEVMFEAPVPGKPSGMIIQLIEPGYILHDRLLRPARVGVAKGGENGSEETGPKVDTQA